MFDTRSGFRAWVDSLNEIVWWEDISPNHAYRLLKNVVQANDENRRYFIDGFDRMIDLTDIYLKCKIVDTLSEDFYDYENE